MQDNRGDTPLHMAAQFGAFKSIRSLLDAGADPLLPNFDLELPEEVICECLDFAMYPDSLQCPEGSCSDVAIEDMRRLFNPDAAPRTNEGNPPQPAINNESTPDANSEVTPVPSQVLNNSSSW